MSLSDLVDIWRHLVGHISARLCRTLHPHCHRKLVSQTDLLLWLFRFLILRSTVMGSNEPTTRQERRLEVWPLQCSAASPRVCKLSNTSCMDFKIPPSISNQPLLGPTCSCVPYTRCLNTTPAQLYSANTSIESVTSLLR